MGADVGVGLVALGEGFTQEGSGPLGGGGPFVRGGHLGDGLLARVVLADDVGSRGEHGDEHGEAEDEAGGEGAHPNLMYSFHHTHSRLVAKGASVYFLKQ